MYYMPDKTGKAVQFVIFFFVACPSKADHVQRANSIVNSMQLGLITGVLCLPFQNLVSLINISHVGYRGYITEC